MRLWRIGGLCALATLTVTIIFFSAAPADATASPFTEEAVSRGIAFNMAPYPQPQGYVGQGVGFVDLDSDGDPDLVVIGRQDGRVGIFENIGGGMFVDHTPTTGIPVLTEQEGFAAADYDADGDLDLYITQAANTPNLLMKNNGNFTFMDATIASGTSNGFQTSTGPTWGDYNDDGWLDLYVSNYGQPNALYRNNGASGTFSNLAVVLGVTGEGETLGALSFQTVWSDYDRDGDVDLYLSNDRAVLGWPTNILWENDGGSFTDVSDVSGAGVAIFSMGLASGDLDNNGYPDYYVTNIWNVESDGSPSGKGGPNPLLLNQGDGTFIEDTLTWGTANESSSWAAIFFDWDNDGNKDLYVNNQFEPNHFFHCDSPPPCTERGAELHVTAEFDPDYNFTDDLPTIASYSSAVADVDGDGDLDLVVNNLGHRAELFINQEGHKHNFVRYDVVGEHPNLFAIGAAIDTTVGARTQFDEIYAGGNGYLGQNELIVHVGLGDADKADQTVVQWPSGGPTRTLTNLPAGSTWKIYPPSHLCDREDDGITYADFEYFAACYATGFSSGCEMMDEDGDSSIGADDLVECYVTAPSDCNGNGVEDLAEIMLDLTIDADENSTIDCCDPGPATEPNPVGATLFLDRNGSDQAVLSWTAPPVDGDHGPATRYNVFRAVDDVQSDFGLLADLAPTTYTDTDTTPSLAFYVVSARNLCGTSGEEPF